MIVLALIQETHEMVPMNATLHTEFGELNISLFLVIEMANLNNRRWLLINAPMIRLESFVIHMFQKGITMTEIAHLIEQMYGHHYTPQTISNMTKAVSETGRSLSIIVRLRKRYVCVYLDATYIAVNRDTVSKEAVYIAVGIREDGSKEVLSLYNRSQRICLQLERAIRRTQRSWCRRGAVIYFGWIKRHGRRHSNGVSESYSTKRVSSMSHVIFPIKFVYKIEGRNL